MTICIAAICDDGQRIVLCADRMFTQHMISVEFETAEQKIEPICANCVALSAGTSAYATEILTGVRNRLNVTDSLVFTDVADYVRAEYDMVRAQKAEEAHVSTLLGADFEKVRAAGMTIPVYLERQPAFYQWLAQQLASFALGVEFIVAGIDRIGAHVMLVTHPGTIVNLEKLGYAAVGTGCVHATTRLSIGGQMRSRTQAESVLSVYQAKVASECAPGVGKATDMAVLDGAQGLKMCSSEFLDVLHQANDKSSRASIPELGEIQNACDKLLASASA